MKRNILFGTIALMAGSLLAADSPQDEVKGAAKKLADAGSYSWKSSVQNAGGGGGGGGRGRGGFGGGPREGKLSKDGIASITITGGQNTTEAFVKGDKVVVKNREGVWQTLAEMTANAGQDQGQGRRGGRGGGAAAALRNFKAPAVEAQDLVAKVKELKKGEGVYSGDLTEDGARSLFLPGGGRGRGGANAPAPTGVKGSAKFWVKDGVLSKFEYNVQGKMTVGQDGNEIEINRTTTVELKDVGTTTVTVPDEVKKKLS